MLDTARIIGWPNPAYARVQEAIRLSDRRCSPLLIILWATALGPEPPARISISPSELVRAVTIQRDSLIELCLIDHVDPNGHDAQGRTPLLIATSQQDWKTAQRLIDAGALVDLADKNGFTPLMAAAMHGNLEMFGSAPGPLNQSSRGKPVQGWQRFAGHGARWRPSGDR